MILHCAVVFVAPACPLFKAGSTSTHPLPKPTGEVSRQDSAAPPTSMTAPGRASVVSLNSNNAKNAMTKALARHGRTPQVAAERASILSGRVELRVVTDADESGAVAEAEAKIGTLVERWNEADARLSKAKSKWHRCFDASRTVGGLAANGTALQSAEEEVAGLREQCQRLEKELLRARAERITMMEDYEHSSAADLASGGGVDGPIDSGGGSDGGGEDDTVDLTLYEDVEGGGDDSDGGDRPAEEEEPAVPGVEEMVEGEGGPLAGLEELAGFGFAARLERAAEPSSEGMDF